MSEQAIDIRATWAVLRRRGAILAAVSVVGVGAGVGLAYTQPPVYASTSKILLPVAPEGTPSAAASHTIDTQVEIAKSEAVLGPAGQAVVPHLGPAAAGRRVDVQASTNEVLVITATGSTPARAEALSKAVADAEIRYLEQAASSLSEEAKKALTTRSDTLKQSLSAVNDEIKKTQGRISKEKPSSAEGKADAAALAELTAQQANLALQIDQVEKTRDEAQDASGGRNATVIQQASPAAQTPLAVRAALYGAVGGGAMLLLAALVVLVRGRRERTRRSRDEIADAVGIPVLASIQSRAPRSVAGWITLLKTYSPDNVEMWSLRQLLRVVTPGHAGSLASPSSGSEAPDVVVLTLSGDSKALAVGPQIASFAATTGMRTHLLTDQSHDSATALWAACSTLPAEAQPRPGLSVNNCGRGGCAGDLAVHVAVVDRLRPTLHLRPSGSAVTLLAVTAGSATADELARVALAADDAGLPVVRIVVADPDPLDRTTGRLLASERAEHLPLPSLMTGSPVAGDAATLETRRRLR